MGAERGAFYNGTAPPLSMWAASTRLHTLHLEARMEREYKRDENTIIHPLKISLVSEAQVM